MALKTIRGNQTLARQIKLRRNEMGLTIEEAASRAGVGTKTWSRYEAGESIRRDKCKGICKALNWSGLLGQVWEDGEGIPIQEYKSHEAWSSFLENAYGARAAMSFAAGSDILLDHIKDDLIELTSMPVGSHLGQLSVSWLCEDLPEQFMMHYDYNFLYQMKCLLLKMRKRAKNGSSMVVHSVMEELILYLCNEKASALMELGEGTNEFEDNGSAYSKDWVFDMFGDMDIISFLYSDLYLDANHPYHFLNWNVQKFYTEQSD